MRFTVAAADQGPRKESALSLGQYPAVGLPAARKARDAIKAQSRAGKNPTVERNLDAIKQAADRAATFRSIAAELVTAKVKDGISSKYAKKIDSIFRSCLFPLIGVVSRNPRNFRHPRSSPATRASRSIILPSLWKV